MPLQTDRSGDGRVRHRRVWMRRRPGPALQRRGGVEPHPASRGGSPTTADLATRDGLLATSSQGGPPVEHASRNAY